MISFFFLMVLFFFLKGVKQSSKMKQNSNRELPHHYYISHAVLLWLPRPLALGQQSWSNNINVRLPAHSGYHRLSRVSCPDAHSGRGREGACWLLLPSLEGPPEHPGRPHGFLATSPRPTGPRAAHGDGTVFLPYCCSPAASRAWNCTQAWGPPPPYCCCLVKAGPLLVSLLWFL